MKHLLAVDDDPAIIRLLEDILEATEWRVTACRGGDKALEAVRAEMPDVVLLDLRLGSSTTGWDVLDRLRQDRSTSRVPLVIFSGDMLQEDERTEWLSAQGIPTLSKPFELDDLYSLLETAAPTSTD